MTASSHRFCSVVFSVIICAIVLCSLGVLSIILTGCQDSDFTISEYERGEVVANEEQGTRAVSYISLDKVNYDFNEETQTFYDVTGVFSLNATVVTAGTVETVEYSISQSDVTLCIPDSDYSADVNAVASLGRSQLIFKERSSILYAPIGIIIQPQQELPSNQGVTIEEKLMLALVNHLDANFLTVTVTYDTGVCVSKSYSLSAKFNDNSGDITMLMQEI